MVASKPLDDDEDEANEEYLMVLNSIIESLISTSLFIICVVKFFIHDHMFIYVIIIWFLDLVP